MISSRPAGRQLFLTVHERIERGHYAPGSWLPTERALAEEFHVNRSAIRQVLQELEDLGLIVRESGRRPWVREGRDGVDRRTGIGAASGPRVGLRTVVAILPQHPVYPASLAILHGLSTVLRSMEAPFRLQVIDTHGGSPARETSLERQALESVAQDGIAGVLLWHLGGAETLPQLVRLEEHGTPVVFVDRCPAGFTCDFVGCDNRAAIETAVEYLRQLGHRRIGYLTTDEQTTAVQERLAAYRDAMLMGGVAPDPSWVFQVSQDNTTDVAPACHHYFALPHPPTAVIALNDSFAHYFITACEKAGHGVPGDISVIGFDDVERHSPRPALLTTLHQPFEKMGRRAAELLLRRLAAPDSRVEARQHILLPAPLVIRSTCRPLPGETPA